MIGLLLTVQGFSKQPIDGSVGASAGTIAPLHCTVVFSKRDLDGYACPPPSVMSHQDSARKPCWTGAVCRQSQLAVNALSSLILYSLYLKDILF